MFVARDRFGVLARGPLSGGGVENASRALLANLSLLFHPSWRRCGAKSSDLLVEHGIAVIIVLARRGRTMSENPFSLRVYLFPQSPLLWLTVTLPVAVALMVR